MLKTNRVKNLRMLSALACSDQNFEVVSKNFEKLQSGDYAWSYDKAIDISLQILSGQVNHHQILQAFPVSDNSTENISKRKICEALLSISGNDYQRPTKLSGASIDVIPEKITLNLGLCGSFKRDNELVLVAINPRRSLAITDFENGFASSVILRAFRYSDDFFDYSAADALSVEWIDLSAKNDDGSRIVNITSSKNIQLWTDAEIDMQLQILIDGYYHYKSFDRTVSPKAEKPARTTPLFDMYGIDLPTK